MPFVALPDEPTGEAWTALRLLVRAGGVAVLFREAVHQPAAWVELFRMPTLQMIGGAAEGADDACVQSLTAADVREMLALTERTAPGPFSERTIELGAYLGLRHDGVLVAMAGERMHVAGHVEVSAVCTDPSYRGRGLASTLVRALVARIRQRGEIPFLHVVAENVSAIRVYEGLGFTRRRSVEVVGLRAVS